MGSANYNKAYYEKHKEIRHAALNKPCCDCGIQYPPEIMEFDHVRGEKKFNICHSTAKNYVSYDELHEEILKCDVRCPNCHRLRHYRERLKNKENDENEDD